MKIGDLVKWSLSWLAGCSEKNIEDYRNQLGVVTGKSETTHCYKVTWSDGMTSDVHRDYLEAL
tara:strand:+ start:1113 stop:1301 length:189 start_codon:yes stop_codon:yes gene_type:complete